jgi:hydroxymethylbilane synthase
MPLAAFVTGMALSAQDGGATVQLNAAWGDPVTAEADSGALPAPLVRVQHSAVVNNFQQAEALGEAVAAQLRAGGAVWAANAPAA